MNINRYKKILNLLYARVREDPDLARQRKSLTKEGRKGIQCGCKATIIEAMKIIKKAWETVGKNTIQNCFVKAAVLPENETILQNH
jgi:hypothetical protein